MPPDMYCQWCGEPADIAAILDDFGPSVDYCSTACEDAHGDSLLRSQRREQELALRAHRVVYARSMFGEDWHEHAGLAPEGATRCRNCTTLISIPAHWQNDFEFCSADCEQDFHEAHARWCQAGDSGDDEATPSAVADVKIVKPAA